MGKIPWRLLVALLLTVVLVSMQSFRVSEQSPASTQLYISPDSVSEPIATTFSIEVGIADVADLKGFDIILGWDTAVLDYVSHVATPEAVLVPTVFTLVDEEDPTAGTYRLAAASLTGGFSGSGVILNLTLSVAAEGFSALEFLLHDLADSASVEIEHGFVSGIFDNRASARIAIEVVGSGTTNPEEGVHWFDVGSEIPVEAFNESGWALSHWLLDGANVGDLNPFTVIMYGDHNLTAVFIPLPPIQYELVISVDGLGSTTPAPGSHLVDAGTEVNLTALANLGWVFSHWSGDLTGSANPETFIMDGNKSVTAAFVPEEYTLTINIVGNGSVSVSNPGPYHYGDRVGLFAYTSSPWVFVYWSGDLTGTGNDAFILMYGNKTVTATFIRPEYTLLTNVIGNGAVDLNATGPYHLGDAVELTATPSTGWGFYEWSGDLTGSTNPATIIMNSDRVVNATFIQEEYTLTISVVGNGWVSLNHSDPYYYGDTVEMTAHANLGWEFLNWTGDLTGSNNPATIIITGHRTVTAAFVEIPPVHPSIRSSDDKGIEKDAFTAIDSVYASGEDFRPWEQVKIYVVYNGDPFVSTVSVFNKTVQADELGVLSPVQLGVFPVGQYDIWVDRDGNGELDPATEPVDCFDMEISGFFVIPEYYAGTVVGLLGCFAAFLALCFSKRRKHGQARVSAG